MLNINKLTVQFASQILFKDVSIQFDDNKRYGLVGSNGSGKSTFLKILANEESHFDGSITIPKAMTLGMLKQDHYLHENEAIINVVLSGNEKLWSALSKKNKILNDSNFDHEKHGNQLAELEDIIEAEEGYQAEYIASKILSGLGFATNQHYEPMSSISGGYKLRVLLAKLLFQKPDVLLLDEPTNHLDILSIRWLEDFIINQFKGCLILVSHDRDFINRTCNYIADIDYQTITLYKGNYDAFIQAKDLSLDQKEKEIQNQEKKIAQMQAFVDRFKAKATKARQAQSRAKQIEKIEVAEIVTSSRRHPKIRFNIERKSGKDVLYIRQISKSFAENKVLQNVSFEVKVGEKIAIIGKNGIGKSTLLKIIVNELEADSGEVQFGVGVKTSYFAQDYHSILSGKINVYEWLYSFFPSFDISKIRGTLGNLLFSKDEVDKMTTSLSGGESARLLLAKIILEKANLLLLDEPTNHLDLESIEALEDALVDYEGTLLFVSHDKHFVSKVANRIIEISENKIENFAGTYKEFLIYKGANNLEKDDAQLSQISTKKEKKENTYVQKKLLKTALTKLRTQESKIKKEMQALEKSIQIIDEKFNDNDFYISHSHEEIKDIQQQKESAEEKWLLLTDQLEKIKKEMQALQS